MVVLLHSRWVSRDDVSWGVSELREVAMTSDNRPYATVDNGADVDRILTVKQPWADLIMAGLKPVENRSWQVPSTLPQTCSFCDAVGYGGRPPSHRYIGCTTGHVSRFPFRVGIHAAKTYDAACDDRAMSAAQAWLDVFPHEDDPLARTGVLLGSVTVTGCHHPDEGQFPGPCVRRDATDEYVACSPWAEPDAYHWTLADPQPLDTPIPLKGRLGLWKADVPA